MSAVTVPDEFVMQGLAFVRSVKKNARERAEGAAPTDEDSPRKEDHASAGSRQDQSIAHESSSTPAGAR